MDFSKITKEHILEAIRLYKEKGLPDGFGPSSTYDLVHEGEKYPPKAIAGLAANFSSGEALINNFGAGDNSPCFIALRKEGFEIVKKYDSSTDEMVSWLHSKAVEMSDFESAENLPQQLSLDHPLIVRAIKEEKRWIPDSRFRPVVLLRLLLYGQLILSS